MELRQLRAVLAIADHGSFTAAADALDTVQSNISAHIARLEKELDVALVDRATGQLTPAGQVVVEHARQVVSDLTGLVSDLAALEDRVVGTVRVGLIGTTARWLVPWLFQAASKRWPLLRPIYTEGTSSSLEADVIAGELDIAIINLPSSSADLVTAPMFEEDLVIVVPVGHELTNNSEISLRDLGNIPLLLPALGTAFRNELDHRAQKLNATILSKADVNSIRLIASLTLAGCGPSILPATAVPSYLKDRWAIVKISDLAPRQVGVARKKLATQSPAIAAVLQLLEEALTDGEVIPPGIVVSTRGPITLQGGQRTKTRNGEDDRLPPE